MQCLDYIIVSFHFRNQNIVYLSVLDLQMKNKTWKGHAVAETEHQAGAQIQPFLLSFVTFHSTVDLEWPNFKEEHCIYPFSTTPL